MTLHVHTARISYRGSGRFDITRKSGGREGHPFAPSWDILNPALEARSAAEAARTLGKITAAIRIETDAWERYVPAFFDEMRTSYRANADAWARLLARDRVVLCCYCADADRCHRRLLAGMILPKLGAVDCGEIETPKKRRLRDRVSEEDLSDHDRAEVAKFRRFLTIASRAEDRPLAEIHDAVYGEDVTGPRDFRVKH
jgi:hypothetical protein